MTARKSPEERRREGGSLRKGAISHRPMPIEPEEPASNGANPEHEALVAELAGVRRLIATLTEIVEREGPVTHGYRGQPVRHPALVGLEHARKDASRLERKLGLVSKAAEPEEDVKPLGQVLYETLGANPRRGALDWSPELQCMVLNGKPWRPGSAS